MQDLDFLPVEYRQRHATRQSQPWRVVVVIGFLALLVAASLSLRSRRHAAEEQLAAAERPYEFVVTQSNLLASIQSELQQANCKAELITYLHHPWPRTQILNALLTPLPEDITLRELRILLESQGQQRIEERGSRSNRSTEENAGENLTPAQKDLKRLRERFDNSQTTVLLDGTTSDSAALHVYLGKLDNMKLFSKAELRSIESTGGEGEGTMRFQAAVIVRPGYGQPGGPTLAEGNTTMRTDRDTVAAATGIHASGGP